MSGLNITTEMAARCLSILEAEKEPIVGAVLAKRLDLGGIRETQRRRVRAIIKHLRDKDNWIVATRQGGYWLTQDPLIWSDYNEHRQIDAKRVLGEAYTRKRSARSIGQDLLFKLGYC